MGARSSGDAGSTGVITHHDLALLCAALYDEPGAPSVSWLYRTPTKDAPIYCGILRLEQYLVVMSRGSFTFQDWLRDLMALAETPYNHPQWGSVHPGFYEGVGETHEIVDQYRHVVERVIYAGHSKGAGNAQLLAARDIDDGILPHSTVVWGEPMSGFQQLVDYLGRVPGVSYQNGDDHEVDRITTVPFSFPPENYRHRLGFTRVTQRPQAEQLAALDLFAYHHFTLYLQATPATGV